MNTIESSRQHQHKLISVFATGRSGNYYLLQKDTEKQKRQEAQEYAESS